MPSIEELRNERAAKFGEMNNIMRNTPRASWTAEHTKRFDALENEMYGVDAEIDRQLRVMDQAGETRRAGGLPARGGDSQKALAALGSFARTGDRGGFGIYASALTEGADSGGIIVPYELSDQIISTQKKMDPMRQVCRVVPIKTTATKFIQPIFNGILDSGWVGEGDLRPETSTAALSGVEFPDAEVYANVPLSGWLEEDAQVGQFVVQEIAKEFARKEGQAFLSGNGTKQPLGFLACPQASTVDEVRPLGTIQTLVQPSGALVTADGLTDLLYALKPFYRQNCTWVLNSKTLAAIRKLKDSIGNYLWQPSVIVGAPATLLGHPLLECENMPDIAPGAVPVAIADWHEGYFILDRTQMLLRDPFSAKPNVLFYARKRVSGAVVDSNAIKLLKIAG